MIILGPKMATPDPEVTTLGLKRANLKPGMLKHGSSLICLYEGAAKKGENRTENRKKEREKEE